MGHLGCPGGAIPPREGRAGERSERMGDVAFIAGISPPRAFARTLPSRGGMRPPESLEFYRPSRAHIAASTPTNSNSPSRPANIGSTPMPRTTLASRIFSPIQSSPL
jgi:hypothetical protein